MPAVATAQETPTAFVQRFYADYLKHKRPDWAKTVRDRRALFDSALADALLKDAAAQAKVSDDIVGLDFDPFLGSQDPGNRFVARKAVSTPAGFRVAVDDLSAKNKPTVLVDVTPRNGGWVITDFRYPETSEDLLSILKSLRQSRTSSRKR